MSPLVYIFQHRKLHHCLISLLNLQHILYHPLLDFHLQFFVYNVGNHNKEDFRVILKRRLGIIFRHSGLLYTNLAMYHVGIGIRLPTVEDIRIPVPDSLSCLTAPNNTLQRDVC